MAVKIEREREREIERESLAAMLAAGFYSPFWSLAPGD